MHTKGEKKNKVNVITLGCSKNIVDSETLMTQMRANDLPVTHESARNDANVVVINTCGFIDEAKRESIDAILHYADKKEKGEIEKLFVTGCLSHRYKEDLEKEIPIVDEYFGTMELPSLLNRLGADYKNELVGERVLTTPAHYAYLKISEGCDRPCSFCAIPLMRGKHISRQMDEIIREAEYLVSRGTKELILIAQDLTYYGLDIYNKRTLNELLLRLSDACVIASEAKQSHDSSDGLLRPDKIGTRNDSELVWIRLHYAFPSGFPTEVLKTIRERENICNYLDIPLQHISDKMLSSMRRGITKEKTLELIRRIRSEVPDIAIRTTLLTGYPGETENDFEELKEFVAEQKFERLGVFTYSHEEGTHAHTLTDDVPDEIKKERANQIMDLQREISFGNNQRMIGRTMKVLIDRKENDKFIGRTEHDSPEVDNEVIISSDVPLKTGEFYTNVKITDAEEFDLFGTVFES